MKASVALMHEIKNQHSSSVYSLMMKEDVGMKTEEVKSTEIIANSLNLISFSYKFCGKFHTIAKSKELSKKFIGILCASESILKF